MVNFYHRLVCHFLCNHSVLGNTLQSHGLHSPWTSPVQNTEVGSWPLFQGMFPTQVSCIAENIDVCFFPWFITLQFLIDQCTCIRPCTYIHSAFTRLFCLDWTENCTNFPASFKCFCFFLNQEIYAVIKLIHWLKWKKVYFREFPGGLVVRTVGFHWGGPRVQGTEILQAAQHSQKQK